MLTGFSSISDCTNQYKGTFPEGLGSASFLQLLETTGCFTHGNGWHPHYLASAHSFVPTFFRHSSSDDFSYDQLFVQRYLDYSKNSYYPKLQVCLPFFPLVTRKLPAKKEDRLQSIHELKLLAQRHDVSSIHVSLPLEEEWEDLHQEGFLYSEHRICYWTNQGFSDFSDFLGTMKSKHRSHISGERATIRKCGFRAEFVSGSEITEHTVHTFYDLFEATHHRKGWKMSFLTREFFLAYSGLFKEKIMYAFLYQDSTPVAASCNFIQDTMLCGRFWGSVTDDHFLHFEIMYYMPIEFCIDNQLSMMEIGFEKPHKMIRGFVPKLVRNFHYFLDPQFSQHIIDHLPRATQAVKNIFK